MFFQLDFPVVDVVYNSAQNEPSLVGILSSELFAALVGTCWTPMSTNDLVVT